jgi:hypothetical protein
MDGDEVVVRVRAVLVSSADGSRLADEVLEALGRVNRSDGRLAGLA